MLSDISSNLRVFTAGKAGMLILVVGKGCCLGHDHSRRHRSRTALTKARSVQVFARGSMLEGEVSGEDGDNGEDDEYEYGFRRTAAEEELPLEEITPEEMFELRAWYVCLSVVDEHVYQLACDYPMCFAQGGSAATDRARRGAWPSMRSHYISIATVVHPQPHSEELTGVPMHSQSLAADFTFRLADEVHRLDDVRPADRVSLSPPNLVEDEEAELVEHPSPRRPSARASASETSPRRQGTGRPRASNPSTGRPRGGAAASAALASQALRRGPGRGGRARAAALRGRGRASGRGGW